LVLTEEGRSAAIVVDVSEFEDLIEEVLLLPQADVKPYVRRNKTDRADAKGLLEAHRNEEIHAVPVKSVAQQTLTSLHRLRSAWQPFVIYEQTPKRNWF
jgi:hypothetical protein